MLCAGAAETYAVTHLGRRPHAIEPRRCPHPRGCPWSRSKLRREERRRYCCCAVPSGTIRALLWPGLGSAGVVEATRVVSGKRSAERRYYAMSLEAHAEPFGRAVRGQWGVENGLHWRLENARARCNKGPLNRKRQRPGCLFVAK